MAYYSYEIKEVNKDEYVFILYPNNIVHQEIGRSKIYSTYKECQNAFENFKTFVKTNKINDENSQYIEIKETNKLCFFNYIVNGEIIFYRKNGYNSKTNAKKIISSIYKHIVENKIIKK